tara:strand:+ start:131 stop:412 length:282 start_codon:yes stop_codon:yes gene_type:complete
MKRRKPAWRNAAYEYIKINGPSTSERLLSDMKTKAGKIWANSNKAPKNASGASQLLSADPRFEGTWVRKTVSSSERRTYADYKVKEWRIVDEE